jgi:CPA2 family monovalent cation:H+ antiporter-2
MGFVFLWAFLDKTFGFGYATASGKGWIDGGSPTEGFLALGMSADPGQLLPTLPAAAALALVTAITKVATGWYAAGRDGAGHRGRLRAGTALIARGEFSVVVIGLAATAQGRLGALVTGYVIILAVCGPILTRLASTRGAPPRKVASDGRAGTFSEPRTPSATSTPCPGRSAARSG